MFHPVMKKLSQAPAPQERQYVKELYMGFDGSLGLGLFAFPWELGASEEQVCEGIQVLYSSGSSTSLVFSVTLPLLPISL